MFTFLLLMVGCSVPTSNAVPAATRAGRASPEAIPPANCVNPPRDVATLVEQRDPVACYGDADLSLDANLTTAIGAIDCPGGLEPAWFGCERLVSLSPAPGTSNAPAVVLAMLSSGPELFAVLHPDIEHLRPRLLDVLVLVTGHYDDPAARECHFTSWPDNNPPPVEEVVAGCRSTFVITGIELLETPTPTDSSPDAPEPDSLAQVATTDLVMRNAPEVSNASVIYPGRLTIGDRLYLVDGPVVADGYDWYLAEPILTQIGSEGLRFGWVAAADRTGEPWIAPVEGDCPTAATVETLHALASALRLYCFGGTPLVIEGDVTCPDLGAPIPTASPAWLTWDGCYLNPRGAPPYEPLSPGPHVGIAIHYPPGAERATGRLLVTAHFNDRAASECRLPVPTQEGDAYTQGLTDREQQLRCRASLVVDEVVALDH